jgi:adenine/guanine phosphoribosyltransferase-like PRPP-binding protein
MTWSWWVVALAAATVAVGTFYSRHRQRQQRKNLRVCPRPETAAFRMCCSQTLRDALLRAGVPARLTYVPPEGMHCGGPEKCAETAAYVALDYFKTTGAEPPADAWKWLFPQNRPEKPARTVVADEVVDDETIAKQCYAAMMAASQEMRRNGDAPSLKYAPIDASEMLHVDTLALYGAPSVLRLFVRHCAAFVEAQRATVLVAHEGRGMAFASVVAAATALPLLAAPSGINFSRGDARVVVLCDIVNSGNTCVGVLALLSRRGAPAVGVFTLADFRSCGVEPRILQQPRDFAYCALASLEHPPRGY